MTVSVGSYLQIAGDAWIGASNVTSQHATASGITGGIAAAGATVSSATANGTTRVDVTSQASGSVGGRLTVNASGWDGTYSEATSGSGGVVEGAAAVANTGNYSQTIARLGTAGAGITAGAVDVAAGHTADFDGRVNTLRASVVGMSGAVSSHSVDSLVQAAIADGARLVTYDLTVLASNHSRKHYFGDSAFQVEAGSGGILDAAAVSGWSTIRHETESLLGQGADVRVVGSWEDPGRANIAAVNQVSAKDSVRLDSGGAISVALATSRIDANLIGRSVIGDGARLETVGDLNVGVRTAANVHASANAKTYGASGAAQGYSASQVQATERVRVGRGAQIVTEGDANFYAGRDADGWDSAITAIPRTDLFNKTALPIATNPDADAVITRSGLIDIEEDASVRTVGDMYLLTANGNLVADGQGTGTDLYRSIVEDIIEMFYDGDLALHIRSGKSTRSIRKRRHRPRHAGIRDQKQAVSRV